MSEISATSAKRDSRYIDNPSYKMSNPVLAAEIPSSALYYISVAVQMFMESFIVLPMACQSQVLKIDGHFECPSESSIFYLASTAPCLVSFPVLRGLHHHMKSNSPKPGLGGRKNRKTPDTLSKRHISNLRSELVHYFTPLVGYPIF